MSEEEIKGKVKEEIKGKDQQGRDQRHIVNTTQHVVILCRWIVHLTKSLRAPIK